MSPNADQRDIPWAESADRVCFCCGNRESRIAHVRVGRAGKDLAVKVRSLMSWYAS